MKLRVVMTLDAAGGVWRYSMSLGRALCAQGHEVVFAGLGPRPTCEQRREAQAVGDLEWGEAPLDWMAECAEDVRAIGPWIDRLVKDHSPDVLHLNLASQASGLDGVPPAVVVCHSCLPTWFREVANEPVPERLRWLQDLTRSGIVSANAVVAPSAAHARLTEDAYGVSGIHSVLNACDDKTADPSPGDGTVVAVARWWDTAKNGAVLDEAAGQTDLPVVMLGPCEQGDGLAFRARHAVTRGATERCETTATLAASSIFVSPSLYEPFGLAALEAARAGRPLVLADIPVYRELWGGVARFFDPRSASDLASVLNDLAWNPDVRIELGAAARARSLKFSPNVQAAAMERIYRRAISASARR